MLRNVAVMHKPVMIAPRVTNVAKIGPGVWIPEGGGASTVPGPRRGHRFLWGGAAAPGATLHNQTQSPSKELKKGKGTEGVS